jgi:hypothetical protein
LPICDAIRPNRVPVPTLIELVMRRLGDLRRHQLGHALDVDADAGFAGTFGDGVCHRFDVAVGGIVENENFCHDSLRELCDVKKKSSLPGLIRQSIHFERLFAKCDGYAGQARV